MRDMERRTSAARFTSSDSPSEPPMRKHTRLFPCTAHCAMSEASSSLEQLFPSMHMATTKAPEPMRASIAAPSRFMSPVSGSSMISGEQ